MKRAVLTIALLASTLAHATPPEKSGRITVLPGWRYTPNDFFFKRARDAGLTPTKSPGGPHVSASFGYMAVEQVELAIDLFGGGERIDLGGSVLSSVSYGATIGPKFFLPLSDSIDATGSIFTGVVLVYLSGGGLSEPRETMTQGYGGTVGLTGKLTDNLSLTGEVKLLLARGTYTDVGGVNAGGVWAGLGLTWVFAPEPGLVPGK